MKRTLLFLTCMLASMTMLAQKYFLEEGKVWTYHYQGYNGREFNVGRIIDGDTIIGGLTHKKIYDNVGGQYMYALREEGKKIYIVYPHNDTASLLYDFSKKAGDIINELAHPLIVASVDTIDIDGVKFRRMRVQDAEQPVEKWNDDLINMYNFWIEGVGSESLLETSIREPGNAYNLVSCQINGRVYTQQELLGIVSKTTPQDDYIPFVKAGKKWNVVSSKFGGNYHYGHYMLMNEKVEKAGKTYMKMYRSEDDMTVVYDAGLLREENRKVYLFDSDMQKEFLLFDYSLKTGDTYETYSYDEQKMVSYKVVSISDFGEGPKIVRYNYDQVADSMTTQYRYLRKWTVRRTDNDLEKNWIEGVGSLEGPLANLYDERPVSSMDYLAYVEFVGEDAFTNPYLPFTFYDTMNRIVHGCNMSSGSTGYSGNNSYEQFTYELEGNRLHVYGQRVSTLCKHYVYIIEVSTDDPLLRKLHFEERDIEPIPTGFGLRTLDFYVPGFDPNMNYIVVDNRGEEHPVINKTPQMTYRPMIEEGKVWKVGDISDNPVKLVEYYYFEGDTIIDGKTCKQMMCQRYVSPDYSNEYWMPTPYLSKVGAWYEKDKKVYVYDEITQSMSLMYDFSLNAYDTLQIGNNYPYVIGPKQTGGLKGFKGVYRNIMGINIDSSIYTTWLEGVGGIDGPSQNVYLGKEDHPLFLISCVVGDEVIYLNDDYEDGTIPETSNAPKQRLDFTHIIKTKPKTPMNRTAEQSLYGEYNDQLLGINLDPLAVAYLVRINNESGKTIYERAINAGNIVALNIDISTYAKGRYTITIENSIESFTGEFDTQTTGIIAITNHKEAIRTDIYNLQGQRISTLQKGLNIVNGRKINIK